MCGIVGITSNDDNFVSEYLKIIKHRGPDDDGEWFSKTAFISHRRLKIIDLSNKYDSSIFVGLFI